MKLVLILLGLMALLVTVVGLIDPFTLVFGSWLQWLPLPLLLLLIVVVQLILVALLCKAATSWRRHRRCRLH
ncbi:hypothetical protein [Ferrimonas senticii]|uniref:hypothetical protein n=1 Tax=Ferrimonas senticii TaxID=394566 RepID=UPI0004065CAE|nr:hypothetical protein [Ferrimonas senticii]